MGHISYLSAVLMTLFIAFIHKYCKKNTQKIY